MPLTYKIFLASPRDMEEERIYFGDIVQELNDRQVALDRHVRFTLYKWERDSDSFAERRKQDVYNEQIMTCAIFVMLYGSTVGDYTEEEFEFAYRRLQDTGSPRIFVLKDTAATPTDGSVAVFEDRVREHEQFKSRYDRREALKDQFFAEIEKLFVNGTLKKGTPATTLYSDGNGVPPRFLGRTDELKAIREKLDKGGKQMLINAEGGIGKTTLAAKYWEESLYDYRYNAWLFCENGIISELKKLAPQLNLDLSLYPREEEQVAALKQALQNYSHDFLLVLDNANDPEHIRVFRETFQGFHWHVLITSRCHNIMEELGQELEIRHLPPPLAKDLFTGNYKEDTAEFDTLLDRLLEALNYHTLLVEVFSKNMRHLARRGEKLADLLTHLETRGLYLEQRSFEIVTGYTGSRHRQAAATDDILDILCDFSELNEEERYWMVNMALLPARQHDFLFLCDLFGQDRYGFRVLDRLAGRGWLIPDGARFRISPVVQVLLLKKNTDRLGEDARDLVDTMNRKLEHNGTYLKNFNGAASYVALVESIIDHLEAWPSLPLAQLTNSASIYYTSTGDLEAAVNAIKHLQSISEKIQNQYGLAIAYTKLGDVTRKRGDLGEAELYFKESLKLFESLHQTNSKDVSSKRGLGIAYQRLGDLAQTEGDLDGAEFYFRKSLKFFEILHQAYPNDVSLKCSLGSAIQRLGDVAQAGGNMGGAEVYFGKYLELFELLYQGYPKDVSINRDLGIAYQRFGELVQTKGDLERAAFYFGKSLVLFESLHEGYPNDVSFMRDLGIAYSKLGDLVQTKGDLDRAGLYFGKFLELFEFLHQSHPKDTSLKRGLAVAYSKLGDVLRIKGDLDVAEFYFGKDLEICELLHQHTPKDVSLKRGLAIAYSKLGDVAWAKGETDQAEFYFRRFLEIFTNLHQVNPKDVSFKRDLGIAYEKLGDVSQKKGEMDKADFCFGKHFEIFTNLHQANPQDVSFKNNLSIAYIKKALLLEAKAAPKAEIIAYFENAEKIWEELVGQFPGHTEFENNLGWLKNELQRIRTT